MLNEYIYISFKYISRFKYLDCINRLHRLSFTWPLSRSSNYFCLKDDERTEKVFSMQANQNSKEMGMTKNAESTNNTTDSVTCVHCKGTGLSAEHVKCKDCRGFGFTSPRTIPCQHCTGTGFIKAHVTCNTCGGFGNLPVRWIGLNANNSLFPTYIAEIDLMPLISVRISVYFSFSLDLNCNLLNISERLCWFQE
jgi:hypothetical protein